MHIRCPECGKLIAARRGPYHWDWPDRAYERQHYEFFNMFTGHGTDSTFFVGWAFGLIINGRSFTGPDD